MMRRARCCLYPAASLSAFVTCHAASTHPERLLTADRRCVALLSNSHDIFENLAAEETLLRGVVIRPGQQFLFMYVNRPCVVIGRNQNYIHEVAFRKARRDGVAVARRASGGGAVYHDTGNVCLSVFTHRDDYHPERSIQILRLFLCREYGIHPDRLTTTSRYDLFLDGRKITGSAMRVQRDISYHHFTLLVSSCRERLGAYLHSEGQHVSFSTLSVGSVRSPVTTLQRAGVLPASLCDDGSNGKAVQHIQDAAAKFFLLHANDILAHRAPWELDPSALITPGQEEMASRLHGDDIFLLDVVGARQQDTPIVDGERRKAPSGSAKSVREEVIRLSSSDWLFSMPKFETRIAVSAADILALKDDTPTCRRITPSVVTYLMQGHERLDITTVVERRRVTSVTVCWVDKAGDTPEEAWCACLLKTLLEGNNVDSAAVDVSEENAVLMAAIQMECRGLLDGMPCAADSTDGGQDALLLFLQALLCAWRDKNVFTPVED
ncbi:lipoate-protein ligase [Trypanosoma grayi]|uniref:lipoate-protein ligase n=1 Tax=Trypanosoma grayi TaxID=71804 RepID=UPI0004F4452D|nr:lipoate-protein ligase [Trypanosoma grayi]KEG11590.1 lipoate-protein ligase [Trypanosoma grayi]